MVLLEGCVTATAHVCKLPAATDEACKEPKGILTGTELVARDPFPKRPEVPNPQQNTCESATAQEWETPEDTVVTVLPANTPAVDTATGEVRKVIVVSPS